MLGQPSSCERAHEPAEPEAFIIRLFTEKPANLALYWDYEKKYVAVPCEIADI